MSFDQGGYEPLENTRKPSRRLVVGAASILVIVGIIGFFISSNGGKLGSSAAVKEADLPSVLLPYPATATLGTIMICNFSGESCHVLYLLRQRWCRHDDQNFQCLNQAHQPPYNPQGKNIGTPGKRPAPKLF